ncbi:Radial spoke head protein 3-like [Hondaea fermentalgiana]|uniref:Radial spoke head protein 3-like n=1 Tax=Hondaea fermentalgiana TaxID=2315210 RepID=A0A2R5GH80_9STRA|nr:Radial spoke head protein 3-like [Hondaea fermentalgiana]|eukprot:GBG28003.1 Radial spoke head protein 3-like [Hondaea fermentalgiana]
MSQQTYTFSAKPTPVQAGRKARGGYRQDDDDAVDSVNIMYDRRVYRGSTYSSHSKGKADLLRRGPAGGRARGKGASQALEQASKESTSFPISGEAPEPGLGRRDMDVQTETYLEELTDKVPETETETQTDPFMDRPSLPLFVPFKTGIDAETQVEVDELFDFDAEVEPILEVLVGKTLEHAMMEVLEEEELAALRAHQEDFEQQRNVERAQVQRMEAEAIRRNEEKARRLEQEKARKAREAEVVDKVAARAFASDYLSDLHNNVFDKLMESGEFYDPIIKEVEDDFLPWLVTSVQGRTDARLVACKLADSLVRRALERRREITQQRKDAIAAARAAAEAAAEAEAKAIADAEAAAAAAEAEALRLAQEGEEGGDVDVDASQEEDPVGEE